MDHKMQRLQHESAAARSNSNHYANRKQHNRAEAKSSSPSSTHNYSNVFRDDVDTSNTSAVKDVDIFDEEDLKMVLDGDFFSDHEHDDDTCITSSKGPAGAAPQRCPTPAAKPKPRKDEASVAEKAECKSSPSIPDKTPKKQEKQRKKPPDESSGTTDITRPKRPPSAYNLFFQLERERLLKPTYQGEPPNFTKEDVARIARNHLLPKPKRKHRKSHGKIGFADLARTTARHWKFLDENIRTLFIERASMERKRYLQEIEEWKRIAGNNAKDDSSNKETKNKSESIAASTAAAAADNESRIKRRPEPPPSDSSMSIKEDSSSEKQGATNDMRALKALSTGRIKESAKTQHSNLGEEQNTETQSKARILKLRKMYKRKRPKSIESDTKKEKDKSSNSLTASASQDAQGSENNSGTAAATTTTVASHHNQRGTSSHNIAGDPAQLVLHDFMDIKNGMLNTHGEWLHPAIDTMHGNLPDTNVSNHQSEYYRGDSNHTNISNSPANPLHPNHHHHHRHEFYGGDFSSSSQNHEQHSQRRRSPTPP